MVTFIYNKRQYYFHSYQDNDFFYQALQGTQNFYEITLLEKLRDIVPEGIFIDLGANVGNHSVYFLTQCKCRYLYSVEADKKMCNVLRGNFVKNAINHSKYEVIEKAITDYTGFARLSEVKDTTCKIIDKNGNAPCTTIDDLFAEISGVTLLKMDIEWQEVNAIKHAERFLFKNNPVIAVELVDNYIFNEFNDIIKKYGYKTDGINYASTPTYIFIR